MNNFISYRFSLLNREREEQYLNYFNGSNDLMLVFNEFYDSLSKELIEYVDGQNNKRTLSITSKIHFSNDDRSLSCNINSGYTGDVFDVRNGQTNSLKYSASSTDVQIRNLFSFVYVPKNKKHGYIVFENKSNHGIKSIFEREFNKFLKAKGFSESRLVIVPGLNYNYLLNMISKGSLKKICLMNNEFSTSIQLSLFGIEQQQSSGVLVKEFKFKTSQNCIHLKNELSQLFFRKNKPYEKLIFRGIEESDDISFVINYRGSSKTFYVKNRSKMRSNINVTDRLDFINDLATYESKVSVAMELIYEIQGLDIDNVSKVA